MNLEPFPHMVLDCAVSPMLLRAAYADFPGPDWDGWHVYHDKDAVKYGTRDEKSLPESVKAVLFQLASSSEIEEFARHLGCPEPFPDLRCYGAGLHWIPPDGFLGRHLDSDHHPRTGWSRQLSCVLFANPEWEPEQWGGEFLMYDKQGNIRHSISPRFNRLIVFNTNDDAYHAVAPVKSPEGRKTISLFFWSQASAQQKRSTAQFSNGRSGSQLTQESRSDC